MQVQVAGLRFEPAGKILQYNVRSLELDRGDKCVAESNFGLAVATVVIPPEGKHFKSQPSDLKRVIRKATLHDLEQAEGYKYDANEALNICREFVQQHQLPMTRAHKAPAPGNRSGRQDRRRRRRPAARRCLPGWVHAPAL